MIYRNAVKKILMTPEGSDHRSAERVSLLCRALSIPNKGLTVIKIMGESGKSACATMLSRALTSCGYCVGTVTTPFSHTMTECIAIDGTPVSMDVFTSAINRVCDTVTELRIRLANLSENDVDPDSLSPMEKALLTYRSHGEDFSLFADELLLATALVCFCEANCRIAIIEIPCGKRAGAYRLPIAPAVSVITSTENISAAEHICRSLDKGTRETVTSLQSKTVYSVISSACAKINCRLTMPLRNTLFPADFAANRLRFFYKEIEYTLHSGAYYQIKNLLTVFETLEAIRRLGLSVDPRTADFQPPFGNAGIDLQFSFLSLHPTVITDFADTPTRIAAFAKALAYQKSFLGSEIRVITEAENNISDQAIAETLAENEIHICNIIRFSQENARRVLKPIVGNLTSSDTLLIIGSRQFVYETTRAFRGLMG